MTILRESSNTITSSLAGKNFSPLIKHVRRESGKERRDAVTLEQIHRAVKKGWHPPDGTPLMDFIWNAALDAVAGECEEQSNKWAHRDGVVACLDCRDAALALKKGGTR